MVLLLPLPLFTSTSFLQDLGYLKGPGRKHALPRLFSRSSTFFCSHFYSVVPSGNLGNCLLCLLSSSVCRIFLGWLQDLLLQCVFWVFKPRVHVQGLCHANVNREARPYHFLSFGLHDK